MKMSINDNDISYVTVKIVHKKGQDIQDIISDCDYNFSHQDIIDTEILEVWEVYSDKT